MPNRPPIHRPPGWKPWEERRWAYDRQRGSGPSRGYDAAWRKLRAQFIRANPWCSELGCGMPTTDVDHVLSVRERPDLRLEWFNLKPYCHPHHSARTSREQSWNEPR